MFLLPNVANRNKYSSPRHSKTSDNIFSDHAGCHLEYLKMLNDAKVASVRFLKWKALVTRISQEKKFEPYFRVPIKYPINLQDYYISLINSVIHTYIHTYKCQILFIVCMPVGIFDIILQHNSIAFYEKKK